MDHGSGTPRLDCHTIAPLLSDYVEERLDEQTRLAVREHLFGCSPCATAAARLDPSILFMSLGKEAPEPQVWAGFDASLRQRLEAEKARPHRFWEGWDFRPATPLGMPRLAFAAPLAMVALLAGLVFVTQPGLILRGPRAPHVEGIRPPNEPAPPLRQADRAGLERAAAGLRPGFRMAAADIASLPTLEEVTSPAARVYRLDVGASPATAAAGAAPIAPAAGDSGAVYFVVDETINF
jgi:anti-sigma factor RsiW